MPRKNTREPRKKAAPPAKTPTAMPHKNAMETKKTPAPSAKTPIDMPHTKAREIKSDTRGVIEACNTRFESAIEGRARTFQYTIKKDTKTSRKLFLARRKLRVEYAALQEFKGSIQVYMVYGYVSSRV